MAFAPRGSKIPSRSPKQSPYRTASTSSHIPGNKAKISLSFDRVQTPSGKASDDACSVRSSCGSDGKSTFKPSGTAWTGDDSATASSQNPSISDMHPARTDNAGMHLIHENTSYSGNAGLVTPAPREGQKFTASLPQLADTSPQHGPSGVSTPVRSSNKTVRLSPAACKSLNGVAAQLWIMAYNQQYTPKHVDGSIHQGADPVEHLTRAVLLHILDTGVGLGTGCMLGSALKSFQTKLAMACLAGLLLLIVGYACLHAISVQNSYSSMHYS
ncbi:hypothetical protein ABBQ32_001724 [Trebouxia sp. C0010 RCD-2024]